MSENNNFIIATGGTGGHIFPARCVALELAKKGAKVVIFANKNYLKYETDADLFISKTIPSSQIKRKIPSLIKAGLLISIGTLKALFLMIFIRPQVVIAFGGYSTFPTLIAAVILRRKIILHEQNAHLGKVNRIFAKFATSIATSFKDTDAIKKEFLGKVKYVGNPVRSEILKLNKEEYQYPNFNKEYKSKNNLGYNLVLSSDFEEIKKIKDEHFNILILGGSGGAKIFSDILPKALFNVRTDLKNKINIIQQCRAQNLDETFAQYRDFNLNITLKAFFSDIDERIKAAHLVIARSGSSSICEFLVAKKPMILVPFANSADNHQLKNAAAIEKGGGGIVVEEADFTIGNVTNLVEKLIDNPKILKRMSKEADAMANIKATNNLVKLAKKL